MASSSAPIVRVLRRALGCASALVCLTGLASAQPAAPEAEYPHGAATPPPPTAAPAAPAQPAPAAAAPPAGQAAYPYPPPAGYYPPPPGYAPPPGYYPPPPGYYGYPPPKKPPRVLPYRDGQEIPPGYTLEEGPIKGLVVAGSIVFGVTYILGLSVASGAGFADESVWILVPVIGPWIALGAQNKCDETDYYGSNDCSAEDSETMAYTFSGLTQATGATLLLAGLLATRKRLIRDEVAQVTVTPMAVGRSGYGLGAFGRF